MLVAELVLTGRSPSGANLGRALSAAFSVGLVENLGDALPDRFARLRRKLLGKLP
jgi:hypothetical protein